MTQTAAHQMTAAPAHTTTLGYVLVPPPDFVLIPATGLTVVLLGTLIAAIFAARVKGATARQSREILDCTGKLGEQLDALQSALATTDARLTALAARLDEHSRTAQGSASTSYNVAIRMARSGASRQELMSTCGVTQQEADLVLRLHASDPAVRSAA